MDDYRKRTIVYVVAGVAIGGLFLAAGPDCRTRRTDQRAPKKVADTQPTSRPDARRGDNTAALVFSGAADASGAVMLDETTLLVADDENNVLRAYRIGGGSPVFTFDLSAFLGLEGDRPEVDIEAGVRVGPRVYWISSHGRNRNGKWRPNRCRFFATDIRVESGRIEIRPAGSWCSELVKRMLDAPGVSAACPALAASYHHGKLSGSAREPLAPKERGLNIEGLCADAAGDRLYVGLRNPLSGGKAVIVPLLNPAAIVDEAQPPRFGRPMLWDLDGLGVRDMLHSPRRKATFILAGARGDSGGFALYRWSGASDQPPVFLRKIDSGAPPMRPEALIEIPNASELLILSDDGVLKIPVSGPHDCINPEHYRYDGTCLNKHLRDETKKHFRGLRIPPEP